MNATQKQFLDGSKQSNLLNSKRRNEDDSSETLRQHIVTLVESVKGENQPKDVSGRKIISAVMESSQPNSEICRPRGHLARIGKLYPKAWRLSDDVRADRGELDSWPDWCYLPILEWLEIAISGNMDNGVIDVIGDTNRLAAIGAWRTTQGIYRFHPTLFESIISTLIDGDLPCEVLHKMPEWSTYIETPGMQSVAGQLYGFYSYLDLVPETGGAELRLLLDSQEGFLSVPIPLGSWSLKEALRRMLDSSAKQIVGGNIGSQLTDAAEPLRTVVEPLVSLLLYLCTQNAEIGDGSRRPVNPTPKKTKRGLRLFAPDKPTTWEVGVRMGSAIRRAQASDATTNDGTHAGPRPHIRRAHWHGFRSGPSKRDDGTLIQTESRKFNLLWLPPIMVNVDSVDDLPATIRPVPAS